jgi:hypothetical protein
VANKAYLTQRFWIRQKIEYEATKNEVEQVGVDLFGQKFGKLRADEQVNESLSKYQ